MERMSVRETCQNVNNWQDLKVTQSVAEQHLKIKLGVRLNLI